MPTNASLPNAAQPQDATMHPAGVREEVDELMTANPWIGGGMKPRSGSGRGGAAAPAARPRGGGRVNIDKSVKTKRPSNQRRTIMSPSQR